MNTNICDFGSVSGGNDLCTESIQLAIDTCAKTGGGVVTVPTGLYKSWVVLDSR